LKYLFNLTQAAGYDRLACGHVFEEFGRRPEEGDMVIQWDVRRDEDVTRTEVLRHLKWSDAPSHDYFALGKLAEDFCHTRSLVAVTD
jgi:hypothetical protein